MSNLSSSNLNLSPEEVDTVHVNPVERLNEPPAGWKLSKHGGQADGDTAIALFNSPDELHEVISPAEERRLQKKIDLMILPYLSLCYAFFYIDKTTLSYAAIFGIKEDLNLSGVQYSWLSSIFYFGFIVWALPTNFLMQKFPVAKYLGVNIFLWGAFLMLQAGARNFTQLAILRAISGAAEACADPSFMMITSMWYTRREQPVRMGIWYTANGIGIALGGVLGFGIGGIKGSLSSWKFEFLIVGALCSVWGIVIYIFVPDSPVTTRHLTTQERRWAVEPLLDIKTWLFFILGVVNNIPNGGISNFGTIIIRGFGFGTLTTTLMQIPYGAIIAISILTCVFLNDRIAQKGVQTRCYFIIAFVIPNIAGSFGLAYPSPGNMPGRLVSYYLTGSYNAAFVMILSLTMANTAGHTKKAVTSAILFIGYCIGNIAGPFFYVESQAPQYTSGIWSMIISHLIEVVIVIILRIVLARENRRRDRLQGVAAGETEQARTSSIAEGAATAFSDLTDQENLNLRYIY